MANESFGAAFGKSLANTAGTGVVSGLINQGFGSWTAARDYKYWKKRTDYQNQLQKEWFNMTNEYNDPSNQRARLEAAGLSPALMYGGSGAGASMSASAADMPDAPSGAGAASSTNNPSYDALSASVIQLNQAKADEARSNAEGNRGETIPARDLQAMRTSIINRNQAEMNLLQKQAKTEEERTINTQLENYAKQRENRIGDATEQVTIDKAFADYTNIQRQGEILLEDIKGKKFQNSMNDLQRKKFIAEYNNTLIDGMMKQVQIQLARVGIYRSFAEIAYICTQDRKAQQEIRNLVAEEGLTLERATSEKQLRGFKKWESGSRTFQNCCSGVASIVNAFKPGVSVSTGSASSPNMSNGGYASPYDGSYVYAD